MKGRNLLVAVAITLVLACTTLVLFYPSGSPLGHSFDVFFILILVHYLALAYGIIVFGLRILRILKNNGLLVYLLAGTLNLIIAIIGIILFMADQADMEWLHKSIANLLVGFLIVSDSFLLKIPSAR